MENLKTNLTETDYADFIETIVKGEMMALNSENGQEVMKKLLEETLAKNPDITPEEWSTIKKNFMKVVFDKTLSEHPELLNNIINGGNENE
jgi:hypothetical protein